MNVERALTAQLISRLSPARVTIVSCESTPWASVTSSGARHEWTLLVEGDTAEAVAQRLQRTISSDEFCLRGHLVADILVSNLNAGDRAVRLDIEALTVQTDC